MPNENPPDNLTDITIEDVARQAGVSVSTVSRILNDKPDVAQSTRQRVKQVMEELGYAPHALAQRLAANRSRSIALLFPLSARIDRGEVATFIVRTALAAEKENYMFSLVAAPTTEHRLLSLYRSAQVEGVILMEVHLQDWRVELLKKQQYPFVMIGRCEDNSGLSLIDLDFEEAVVLAVDHLVELNHRRIAVFNSGMLRQEGYGPAVRSFYGMERALEKHSIDLLLFETETLPEAVSALIESNVTAAIFAVSTLPMTEVLRPVIQQGYRVPEDLSIVCLQGDEVAKNLIHPMTSVSFDINAAADQAAKMLIDQLEGRSSEVEQLVLSPQLIIRESTALLV
jgi:DNA-binding LacI/PurR family transcriptional regulator